MAYTYNDLKYIRSLIVQAHTAKNAQKEKILRQKYGQELSDWTTHGRPGAVDELAKRYTNTDQVLGRLLPFDESSALDRLNTKRTYDQNLIALNNQRNQVSQDYNTQRHVYDQNLPIAARNLLNNYAGRGMAMSTGYGQAVGQQNASLANQLASLDASKQVGLSNIDTQQGQLNAGYQNDLSSILYNTVQNLTSKAGKLGLQSKGFDIMNDPMLLTQLAQRMLSQGKV